MRVRLRRNPGTFSKPLSFINKLKDSSESTTNHKTPQEVPDKRRNLKWNSKSRDATQYAERQSPSQHRQETLESSNPRTPFRYEMDDTADCTANRKAAKRSCWDSRGAAQQTYEDSDNSRCRTPVYNCRSRIF